MSIYSDPRSVVNAWILNPHLVVSVLTPVPVQVELLAQRGQRALQQAPRRPAPHRVQPGRERRWAINRQLVLHYQEGDSPVQGRCAGRERRWAINRQLVHCITKKEIALLKSDWMDTADSRSPHQLESPVSGTILLRHMRPAPHRLTPGREQKCRKGYGVGRSGYERAVVSRTKKSDQLADSTARLACGGCMCGQGTRCSSTS